MEQETVRTLTGRQRLRFYDVLAVLTRIILAGKAPLDEFVEWAERFVGRHAPEELSGMKQAPPEQKADLADDRRREMETFLRKHGFPGFVLPKPAVSNGEIARRAKLPIPQKPFFMPFASQADYDRFMPAVGQAKHWTVTNEADRAKIVWEFSATDYWFWAEVSENCPRLNTSRNQLTADLSQEGRMLLSLEEYVIVWHMHKAETGKLLDCRFRTLLRTLFGSGYLYANEYDGRVGVMRNSAGNPSVAVGIEGGRSSEVAASLPLAA